MPGNVGPLGHSRAAHRIHGWCASCPDRTAAEEAGAWCVREEALFEQAGPGAVSAHSTVGPCPGCGHDAALNLVRVTALTTTGERAIGGWGICRNCEYTPYTAPLEADHG